MLFSSYGNNWWILNLCWMFRFVPFRFALPLNWKCIPFFKRWKMRHIHRHIHVLADSLAGNKWESERRRREKNQMSSIIISIFIRLHRKRGPFYSDGNSYNMVVCMHVKMYTTVNTMYATLFIRKHIFIVSTVHIHVLPFKSTIWKYVSGGRIRRTFGCMCKRVKSRL